MEKVRELLFFKQYFYEFFDELSEKVKDKIDYVLYVIKYI